MSYNCSGCSGYKNNHRIAKNYGFEPPAGRYDGLNKVTGYVESKTNGGLSSPGQYDFFKKHLL